MEAVALIGAGGHAFDINAVTPFKYRLAHHSEWHGGDGCVLGINDPQVRAKIAADLGIRDQAWVHPDAKLYSKVTYGYGTHINYGVHATRATIGNHCTISPGVTICGDVIVGDRVLIGAGAVICDRVTIGDDVIVGAGAIVLPETVIPDGQTWLGVPARAYPVH